MKKSQALAALALAFALGLGVVAPVANTYAQITPNDATQEQKNEIYDQTAAILKSVADLDNYSNYENLYNILSSEDGLIDSLNDAAKAELRWFNENMTVNQSVNQYIDIARDYISDTTNGVYAKYSTGVYKYINSGVDFKDAELKPISRFGKVSTLQDAYAAVENASKAVADNIAILKKNYKYDSSLNANQYTAVEKAIANYDAIRSHLDSWMERVDAAFWYADENVNVDNTANYVKNISESAYDKMVDSDAWTNTEKPGIKRAIKAGELIRVAKALPKYNFVNAVAEAKANVEKIQASNPSNVDYAVAKQYIAALTTAINNYKNGTATNPSTPAQNITLKTEDGTISVTGNFAGTSVAAVKAVKSDKKVSAFGDRKYGMWDIELVDKDGNEVTFQGSVVVRVKVPEGINGAKSNIYYVNDKGQVEKIDSRIEGDYMVFTAAHFSLYAIVEDNGQVITAPKTGILAGVDGDASTTVAMVAGVATALTAAGAGVVAYRNARRSTRK